LGKHQSIEEDECTQHIGIAAAVTATFVFVPRNDHKAKDGEADAGGCCDEREEQ
jgi:hypothetical protein